MRGVILQGSSKSNGNTNKIALFIKERTGFDIIDLKSKNIGPFDYDFKNRDDDFLPTIKEIVENYDTLIFATPVYWYAMSGIMKTFMDRITDCIKIERTTGRKLRGKKMVMISCGSGSELKKGFTMPFIESAHYLGMEYLGDIHTWIEDENIPKQLENDINVFISEKIKKKD
ncbi:multimeric flavodoxin WrbA [Aquimarina sp. EL_43]|uniref:flavodoxin family protein n=1 Tax=unclassified Aquimarina TaxID=2627091 RepID=UPI0018CAB265|nr:MULTISPECIES: NAD(P)H-dependent oxidoreductase [unclassified Aquimarina]MBG6132362.1 multimeric flavodoxin WrbA [Aquimarina sp. EL_35]MBG6152493.1 multimeric flavodoxin WrbA [Aquimarina sp. EL_32]MBG6170580.1 multimeric flavodoxin WrbA [Aquimarina sp. EL_43]